MSQTFSSAMHFAKRLAIVRAYTSILRLINATTDVSFSFFVLCEEEMYSTISFCHGKSTNTFLILASDFDDDDDDEQKTSVIQHDFSKSTLAKSSKTSAKWNK